MAKLTEEEYRAILSEQEETKLVQEVTSEITEYIINSVPKELVKTSNGVSLAYDCIANVLVRFMRAYGITEDDIISSLRKANRILDEIKTPSFLN